MFFDHTIHMLCMIFGLGLGSQTVVWAPVVELSDAVLEPRAIPKIDYFLTPATF